MKKFQKSSFYTVPEDLKEETVDIKEVEEDGVIKCGKVEYYGEKNNELQDRMFSMVTILNNIILYT